MCIGLIAYRIISRKLSAPTKRVSKRTGIRKHEENIFLLKFVELREKAVDLIVGRIKLNSFYKDDLIVKIQRLGIDTTPERIRALQYLYVGLGLIVALVSSFIHPFLVLVALVFTILFWYFPVDEMDKEIKKRNVEIEKDFPSFYNMFYHAYKYTIETSMRDVVLDFLPNASPSFERELNRFLDDEKEGERNAIRNLRKRIPLSFMIRFCDLIEARVVEGQDNVDSLFYFKKELDQKRIQTLEKKLDEKVMKANLVEDAILIPIAILLLVIHFSIQIAMTMSLF